MDRAELISAIEVARQRAHKLGLEERLIECLQYGVIHGGRTAKPADVVIRKVWACEGGCSEWWRYGHGISQNLRFMKLDGPSFCLFCGSEMGWMNPNVPD